MFSACICRISVSVSKISGRKFCLPDVSAWTMFSANTLDLECIVSIICTYIKMREVGGSHKFFSWVGHLRACLHAITRGWFKDIESGAIKNAALPKGK